MTRAPADEGRRTRIVRESARLFRERGYEATSVRDIAAATGLQSGSWVYHFKTKQDILAAVMEEGLSHALERIEAIGAQPGSPRERLRALVRTHLETILGPGQDYIPVLLYEWRALERRGRPRVVALQQRYEAVWDDVIAALQRSGDWAMPTPLDRLLMFGALNWVVRWYRPGGALDIESITEAAMQFILRTPAVSKAPAARSSRRRQA